MADHQGTTQLIVTELGRVLEPVTRAVEDGPEGILLLLDRAGILVPLVGDESDQVMDVLTNRIAEPVSALLEAVSHEDPPPPSEIPTLLGHISKIFTGVRALSEIRIQSSDIDDLGKNLLDFLLIDYLYSHQRPAHDVLALLGMIKGSPPNNPGEIDLSLVGTIFDDPTKIAKQVYHWGDPQQPFEPYLILFYARTLLRSQSVRAELIDPAPDDLVSISSVDDISDFSQLSVHEGHVRGLDEELRIPIVEGAAGTFGLRIIPVPQTSNVLGGLALVPFGLFKGELSIDINKELQFQVKMSSSQDDWGLLLQPESGTGKVKPKLISPSGGPVVGHIHSQAGLTYAPEEPKGKPILGEADGTNVSLKSSSLRMIMDSTGDGFDIAVELPITGYLAVKPEGGFLSSVFPENFTVDFDAAVGWSNQDGLYFESGGTLEAAIPMHLDLGFGAIEEIYIAIDPTSERSDFSLEAATTPKIDIGPVKGRVKRLGVRADVSFPQDRQGNMGMLDLGVGFRPPDGLSLKIDTGAVTGEGALSFYPEKGRYTGAFNISIQQYGVGVTGLLKTKLPDSDGFSLLLIISAQLSIGPLVFGLFITRIGGLAGIHRGFKLKPLGRAVRGGTINSLMFPKNVVDNADQIFTDLETIFPPRPDFHVFGPMVEITHPTMMRAQIAVLVSVPSWKIALVGKFVIAMPDEESGLIRLKIAVLGALDIPKKRLAIDASLYDSKIVKWTVAGDMAMRHSWGEQKRFVLSIGGFHPRYTPPDSFPELDRVRASLSVGSGQPRIELTGYFAITPNTFQVGASVTVQAEAGPAGVDGQFSFDALFRFNPFSFVVDFHAEMAFRFKGQTLGFTVDGTIKGPQPYRIKGKVRLELFLLTIKTRVNVKIGPTGGTEEMPTADVLSKLAAELGESKNWVTQPSDTDAQLIVLREGDDQGGLHVHPLATIGVRQQIVPLGEKIDKFGNAKPLHTLFEIAAMTIGDTDHAGSALYEEFAPAQFNDMTDDEKMQAPAFKTLAAGRMMEQAAVKVDESRGARAHLIYEDQILDDQNERYRTSGEGSGLSSTLEQSLTKTSAVARSGLYTTGTDRYRNEDNPMTVSLKEQRYVMVWDKTLQRVEVQNNPAKGLIRTEAEDRMSRWLEHHPDQSEDVRLVGPSEVAI